MTNHNSPGLQFGIPRHIAACLLIFFLINMTAILSMRGIDDPEGYLLNTSKLIPVNTYEDDAQVSIGHALGLFPEVKDTFSIGTNFGGPLLLASKPIIWGAYHLGIIKLSQDRLFYVTYPEELRKIWQLFAFYKLMFLLLLPLGAYWLGKNFIDETTGSVAAWLIVFTPYVTAFELRLKPEGIVLALTLLFLLHLLQFLRSGRERNLLYSVILLGLAFSMKFTLAVAMLLVPVAIYESCVNRGRNKPELRDYILLFKAAGVCLLTFLAANPLFLFSPSIFIGFVNRYQTVLQASSSTMNLPQNMLDATLFRFLHFDTYLGSILNYLSIPAFLYGAWQLVANRFRLNALSTIFLIFSANFLFLWWVAHGLIVKVLSYYFYSQSILMVLMISALLGWALRVTNKSKALNIFCRCAVLTIAIHTLSSNFNVLSYLMGPSSRQTAHAWMSEYIPLGQSIGIPIAKQEHLGFSDRFMLDPFHHRLVQTGENAEFLKTLRPQYLVTNATDPIRTILIDDPYKLVAIFDTGNHLPRESYSAYQDDIYSVYRLNELALETIPGPGDVEAILGNFVRSDPEPDFTIISYKALTQRPLTLDIFQRTPSTVLPLPTYLFTSALRDISTPISYLHQIPRDVLTLWGVKYVLALEDVSFQEHVTNNAKYTLSRVTPSPFNETSRQVGLYLFNGYRGRVFFLPSAPDIFTYKKLQSYWGLHERFQIKPFGVLYQGDMAKQAATNLIRVRMTLECTGSIDLILKGGERSMSVLLGPGRHEVDLPYRLIADHDAGYEINPATHGAKCTVLSVSAQPMDIDAIPQTQPSTVSMRYAFAKIEVERHGEVVFALPWHPYWRTEVDGQEVQPRKGPGNTLAIPTTPGSHTIIARFR